MEPQQDLISTSSAASKDNLNQEASKMGESGKPIKGENDSSTVTPSYRPPGYPDLGMSNLWMQPPQQLPGPDDHPFFRWVAEGAKKDPAVLTTAYSGRNDRRDTQTISGTYSPPSVQTLIQPQTIYPFVPVPTVAMEPITPDLKPKKSFLGPSPSNTTPDLSFSPTEPSPQSAHTATPSQAEEGTTEHEAESGKSPPKDEETEVGEADTESQDPKSILNGQIWRSGSKRGDGWRRHQWSLDVG